MMWGRQTSDGFYPDKILWLVDSPHPHWVETQKDNLKLDFKETGFRQFVSLNSKHIITDAMLMFGINYANSKNKLVEALNPLRLSVRVNPGSYLGISHHFLGAPFELEQDEVLREFLNSARRLLEDVGFACDVVVISHNAYIEDIVLSNLERINGLKYRFYGKEG
ncbi:hypothetical protein [Thermocrinis sp.]